LYLEQIITYRWRDKICGNAHPVGILNILSYAYHSQSVKTLCIVEVVLHFDCQKELGLSHIISGFYWNSENWVKWLQLKTFYSPDLQDTLSLYFWEIAINTTTDLTWSTRCTGFVLLRHCYQHHSWSHLIYKMNWLCTSETFLSTPLLISPDLQDELSFHFW
jgi:hypothetical protein